MKLGIGSYTFGWGVGVPSYKRPMQPITAIELLERCRNYKVDLLQICCNMPLHLIEESELERIRKKADEYNVCIEIGNRGILPDYLLTYLKIANKLNSKILRTLLCTPEHSPDIDQAVSWFKKVIPAFEDSGVSIAVENHDKHTSKELIELIERVDSPNIGICLDTTNSYGALESTQQVVENLSPYTINLHLKDYDIVRVPHGMGFNVIGRRAGEGRLDSKWIIEKVKQNGRNANVILEQWAPLFEDMEKTIANEEEWARKGIDYLKILVQQ